MPEEMVEILVYHTVSSLWVPHLLTEWHRLQGKKFPQLQNHYAVKDDIPHGINS